MLCLALFCVGLLSVAAESRPDGTIACDPANRPVLLDLEGVQFSTPNYNVDYYPNNLQCEWHLHNPDPAGIVSANFEGFVIEECVDCLCDYVQFFAGVDDTGADLGKYCGSQTSFGVGGFSQDLFIRFVSDDSLPGVGFQGVVSYTAASGCGGIFATPSGTFTSPNYPNTYDNDLDCTYLITADATQRVEIKFSQMSLEQSCGTFGSIYDYVDIYETDGNRLARWFGVTQANAEFTYASYAPGAVRVLFISDFTIGGIGWSASYTMVAA